VSEKADVAVSVERKKKEREGSPPLLFFGALDPKENGRQKANMEKDAPTCRSGETQ